MNNIQVGNLKFINVAGDEERKLMDDYNENLLLVKNKIWMFLGILLGFAIVVTFIRKKLSATSLLLDTVLSILWIMVLLIIWLQSRESRELHKLIVNEVYNRKILEHLNIAQYEKYIIDSDQIADLYHVLINEDILKIEVTTNLVFGIKVNFEDKNGFIQRSEYIFPIMNRSDNTKINFYTYDALTHTLIRPCNKDGSLKPIKTKSTTK